MLIRAVGSVKVHLVGQFLEDDGLGLNSNPSSLRASSASEPPEIVKGHLVISDYPGHDLDLQRMVAYEWTPSQP